MIKESELPCEEFSKTEANSTNAMEEKNKTDSHIHFGKIGADDANDQNTMGILDQMTGKKEMIKDVQEDYEDYTAVRRSNSVSKMTQYFKTLQEKVNTAAAENCSQHSTTQRLSYGMQRYRERKIQCSERFNTQPVTFQEVREAVLQNQRNAALNVAGTPDDESEPSKLSLAERVRLFNQKIATADTAAMNIAYQEKFTQKRRPSTRYKTQPVTSEEVEVASRLSSLNINHQTQDIEGKYWWRIYVIYICIACVKTLTYVHT